MLCLCLKIKNTFKVILYIYIYVYIHIYVYIYICITIIYAQRKTIHNATASASSHVTSSCNTKILQQPPTPAITAYLLKSYDANKLSDLNGMQHHLLCLLDHNKHQIQTRAMLSLQTSMSNAERSANLKHILTNLLYIQGISCKSKRT